MTYFFWATFAATLAIVAEVLFRRGWDWGNNLWLFLPIAIGINYGIFRLVSSGPTLLVSLVAFNLAAVLMRTAASEFILHEPVRGSNLVAALALVTAIVVRGFWK